MFFDSFFLLLLLAAPLAKAFSCPAFSSFIIVNKLILVVTYETKLACVIKITCKCAFVWYQGSCAFSSSETRGQLVSDTIPSDTRPEGEVKDLSVMRVTFLPSPSAFLPAASPIGLWGWHLCKSPGTSKTPGQRNKLALWQDFVFFLPITIT